MSSLQQRHNATEPFEALVFTSVWKNFFIRRKCEFANVIISLVKFKRNKSDLEKDRHVSVQEAEDYARSVGADHFSASAKLNKGVTEIFLDISQSE